MVSAARLFLDAVAFEDTIDGYFPLRESIRQMLKRNGFGAAWLSLIQAPIMEIPGLTPDAPVPLYVTEGYTGLLMELSAIAQLEQDDVILSGVAEWRWVKGHRAGDSIFDPSHRMAEPALVRGIGLRSGSDRAGPFLNVGLAKQDTDYWLAASSAQSDGSVWQNDVQEGLLAAGQRLHSQGRVVLTPDDPAHAALHRTEALWSSALQARGNPILTALAVGG